MTERAGGALRIGSATALMAALLAGLHVHASDPSGGSTLRIALRTTAGTAQVCRRVGDAELAATPVHMRRAEICETHALPYRLQVLDGQTVLLDRTYQASGLRGDRPLTVNEDIPMRAGLHDVTIRFAPREDSPAAPGDGAAQAWAFKGDVDFPENRIRVAALGAAPGTFDIR